MVKKEEVVTETKTVTTKVLPKKDISDKENLHHQTVTKTVTTKKPSSKNKLVRKKPIVKKDVPSNKTSTLKDFKTEKILVENFVSLQRIMVDMSSKFGELSKQISELLHLFEESAKTLVKRDFEIEKRENPSEELLQRMDKMIEQNRTIAKGLILMNDHSNKFQENYSPSILPSQTQAPAPPRRNLDEIKSFRKPLASEEDRDKEPEIPKGF